MSKPSHYLARVLAHSDRITQKYKLQNSMTLTFDSIYTSDGGNEQRIWMDARIGWKDVLADPNRHLANGVTQYANVETLGTKLGSQARHVLDNFLHK